MFFRAITMFCFPTTLDFGELDEQLAAFTLKPVGPLEMGSRGFVRPFGNHGTDMSEWFGHAIWLTVGGEDKLLPAAAINKVLADRLEAIRLKEGRTPGGRSRTRIREDVIAEMLTRSHVKPSRIDVLLDMERCVIAIDTSNRRAAESVVSEIRRAMGSFPALPINAEVAPRAVLTGWVAGDVMPEGMSLGEDCTLEDPSGGGKVQCYRVALSGDEVAEHLAAGRQVTRLALVLDDHVSFTLDESLTMRNFKILDGAIDSLGSEERDDFTAELEARCVLMAGEFGRLFDVLERTFKISRAEP